MNKPTLNMIGAGRVGQTLAHLWQKTGTFVVQDVLTSHPASAAAACATIGTGTPVASLEAMRAADVWMLAVPDAQIASVTAVLAETHSLQATQAPIIFHCSGAQNISVLQPLAAQGWLCASAHCILSFANVATALQQFAGTACALEGNPLACAVLHPAFSTIGAQCFDVASDDKILYHAAAVFATNFVPVLQYVAEQAWQETGVPTQLLPHLRQTLLHNAVHNIVQSGPVNALTGPAARGDLLAIEKQAQTVSSWNPVAGDAYRALSALALQMKKKTS